MSREDFQGRIGRLSAQAQSAQKTTARQQGPKRAIGPIAFIFYGLWGFAFGTCLAFLNANYDTIVADAKALPGGAADDMLSGMAAFLLISVGLMGLSVLIALVRLIFGRPSAANWYRIGVFALGMAVSSIALGMAAA